MKATLAKYEEFDQLLETVRRQMVEQFPMLSRNGKTLEVSNVRWVDKAPEIMTDFRAQKKAKLSEKSIVARLVADVVFKDKEGKTIDSKNGYTLLVMPHVTARNSYILEGNEVQVVNQLRLRPGLYTELKGDKEVETYLNTTAAGTYKVLLDRKTGVVRFKIGSDKKVPVITVLRALGSTDTGIRQVLGGLFEVNEKAVKPSDTEKLLTALYPYATVGSLDENRQTIRDFLASKPLDPAVNKITAGQAIDKIDLSALNAAIRKCIEVSNGDAEEDDKESLAFKSLHSLEDFIPEQINKAAPNIKRAVQYNMQNKETIPSVLPSTIFGKVVTDFMTTSEFTRYSDQNNPIDMNAVASTVTILGEGGISDTRAVKNEVRGVHASHFGVLDLTHVPEGCFSADMEVFTKSGWKPWPSVTTNDEFACLLDNGELTYSKPTALQKYEKDEELLGFNSSTISYLVTPQHRMWTRPTHEGADMRFESAEQVHQKCSRNVKIAADIPYLGSNSEATTWELPKIESRRTAEGYGREPDVIPPFDLEDWAELLGWYISEGNSNKNNTISITQYLGANPANVERIAALLDRMGLVWSYSDNKRFTVTKRQLSEYLSQFGHCEEKYLPKEVFEWPVVARERLLESLLLGDGRGRSAYCTTSKQLASDVERLIFDLGHSCKVTFEPDDREPHYKGCYVVIIHKSRERSVRKKLTATTSGMFKEHYKGTVYCATVPGSRLYVRRGDKGGFWCGNSNVGITQHLSLGAKKVGNRIHIRIFDAKTGAPVEMPVEEAMPYTVAFADQYTGISEGKPKVKPKYKKVKARRGNELVEVDPKEVEYIFNDPASFFGTSSNSVPFLNSNSANRVLMANKHFEQSVQLADPDKPLVQHRLGKTGEGYLETFGKNFLVSAPVAGTVKRVKKDEIIITDAKGVDHSVLIHDHYPLNSKTFLHDEPIVEKGDKVKVGQPLVKNNFTKEETISLGKNLRTAMVPYKGYNFEDGTVISYKAAQKLASVHKEEFRVEKDSNVTIGVDSYLAQFPGNLEDMGAGYRDLYDSKGVIKKGKRVKKGTVLIPAIREVSLRKTDVAALHRKILSNTYSDISAVWEKDVPGEVIDVVNDRGFVKVIVKSIEPAVVGDKLSALAGAKGIITKILGPDEVYKDQDGNEIDVLFNHFGCYLPGHYALTPKGWTRLEDLDVGDKIVTYLDPVTHEKTYHEVTHMIKKSYSGTVYTYLGEVGISFEVTDNHRMWWSPMTSGGFKISEMRDVYEYLDRYPGTAAYLQDYRGKSRKLIKDNIIPYEYSGKVYCPTVNGGKFLVTRDPATGAGFYCGNSVGRINPGYLLEAAAGKVAQKTGKTFYVDNFNMEYESNLKHVQDELAKAGISDAETITNPVTGHTISGALVGPIHTLKLKHKISGKFSARGASGSAYTTLEQPKKESGESAQRIAPLSSFSLLSGDATHFLDDAYRIKSQKNDDYWTALQLGRTLPAPKTPYVAEKFVAMLLASGVNLNQNGDRIEASPMTDSEILRISHGEVKASGTLKAPELKPIKGGLFDPDVTGGIGGNKFSHIELAEPIINPLLREAVISVGMFGTKGNLEDVILRKAGINEMGDVEPGHSNTGIDAVIAHLDGMDINKEIRWTSEKAAKSKGTALNKANSRLRYLKALKKLEMKPSEAYINKYVPVLPPKFRQITEMPDGTVSVADANHKYKEIMMINSQLKDLKNLGFDDEALAELRQSLDAAAASNAGVGASVSKGRHYRGIIEEINGIGESKYGFFKSKVLSRPQDLSGRSTIIPNPKLDMDYVGIPKKMGLKIYSPFLVKRLVQNGFKPLEAKKMVEEGDPLAIDMLQQEVKERPVLINRAPELHKFNIMSFHPVLTDGKAVEVNPLIVSGYNADFDGDDQNGTVYFSIKNNLLDAVKADLIKNQQFVLETGFNKDYITDNVKQHVDAYFNSREMTSRTQVAIPYRKDATVYVCDLADFPYLADDSEVSIGSQGNLIRWHKVPEGVDVLAHDQENGGLVWAPASGWSQHVDCPVDIIKLSNGKEIYTDNDPRAVYGISKFSDDLVPQRFRPKEALACTVSVPLSRNLSEVDVGESIAFDFFKGDISSNKYSCIDGPVKIGSELAYALGALVGDGWVRYTDNKAGAVCLSGIRSGIVDRTQGGLQQLIIEPLYMGERVGATTGKHASYGESKVSRWTCAPLARAIAPLIGRGAENKHLPVFALNLPKQQKLAMLAGLIDTDGTITVVQAKSKRKPQWVMNYNTNSLRLAREVITLARSIGIGAGLSGTQTPKGIKHWVVSINPWDAKQAGLADELQVTEKRENLLSAPKPEDTAISGRFDAVPLPIEVAKELKKFIRPLPKKLMKTAAADRTEEQNQLQSLYVVVTRNAKDTGTNSIARYLAKRAICAIDDTNPNPILEKWIKMVEDESVVWATVNSVEETGIRETGYDLTVPGYETFTSVEGVVLSNTVGVHVPVSEDARKEALTKMLPSRNLISPRSDFIMHMPSKETILGVYMMTTPKGEPQKVKDWAEAQKLVLNSKIKVNTAIQIGRATHCYGQKIVNDLFPRDLKPGLASLNAKQIEAAVKEAAEVLGPDKTAALISKLKDLGNHYVTELGSAVSLKDLEFDYAKRDAIIAKLEKEVEDGGDFGAAANAANDELMALLAAATDNHFVEATLSSKATGKGAAVRQMIATPVAVTGAKGKVIPFAIKKSYAEGHDLGSYLGTTPGARMGLVDKGISVADTGYLSRLLVNANIENRISMDDCGTMAGELFDVDSSEALSRYGAEPPLRNQVITKAILSKYKKETKKKTIKVRGALGCKASTGICSKCAGLDADGRPYRKGYHIGALAAQSVGERATQLTLRCNAGENLTPVRTPDGTFILSLKELWEFIPTTSSVDGGVETRYPTLQAEVWTGTAWSQITQMDRHLPLDTVVVQKLANGRAYISQQNHPAYVQPLASIPTEGNIDLSASLINTPEIVKPLSDTLGDVVTTDAPEVVDLFSPPIDGASAAEIIKIGRPLYIQDPEKLDDDDEEGLALEEAELEALFGGALLSTWLGASREWKYSFLDTFFGGSFELREDRELTAESPNLLLINQLTWMLEDLGATVIFSTKVENALQLYCLTANFPKIEPIGGDKDALYAKRRVTELLEVDYTDFVYDVKTASGRLSLNNVRTSNSFHTGGALGGASVGFDRAKDLFKLPQTTKGRAVLSEETGTVQSVVPLPAGGWNVTIAGTDHFIAKELGVKVKAGDPVSAGDQISSGGAINPHDLLETTGNIHRVRSQMIDELTDAYAGQHINRRVFETVVKPMTDKAKVVEQGDGHIYNVYAGEKYSVIHLDEINEKLKKRRLKPIKYESILLGINQIPHFSNDFIGQLSHERLKENVKAAPAVGKATNITKGHPLAQFVLKQFGHVEDIKNPRRKLQ